MCPEYNEVLRLKRQVYGQILCVFSRISSAH